MTLRRALISSNTRGTTQIAVIILPLLESNNPYAFTQQSRETLLKQNSFIFPARKGWAFENTRYRFAPTTDSLKTHIISRLRRCLYIFLKV